MLSTATNIHDDARLGNPRWYAVYTKHQHEKKSADLLARKGLEVYLPLYESVRQWRDRKKTLNVPLFPGYVFLRSTLDNRLEILTTPGIFFIVATAGHACSLPDREIESMKTLTTSHAAIEPHPYLKSGDHVRIRRGPLAGVSGILTWVRNQHRVVLGVELLQKAVSVEVIASDLEKIGAPA
ncbi:MAG TPA: UpxY family transcription antiterminator [Verrucomicrobiae bacterium]|nr:UpxY family transcription antiterminator [Verrucomicrobiae bacterium]